MWSVYIRVLTDIYNDIICVYDYIYMYFYIHWGFLKWENPWFWVP